MNKTIASLPALTPKTSDTTQTLLVIDDDAVALRTLARAVEGQPYRTLTVGNVEEADRVLRRENVDVVLSDHDLGGKSGVRFLRMVRQHHPMVTRMLITASDDPAAFVGAINEAEVFRVVRKPWSDEYLIEQLAEAFERSAADQEELRQRVIRRFENKPVVGAETVVIRVQTIAPAAPPAARVATHVQATQSPRYRRATQPILVVEDDPAMGRVIQRTLVSEGYVTKVVTSNRDALEALRLERHAMAFLDVKIGCDNGFDLARSIRAGEGGDAHRGIPVVYVTAEDDVDSFEQSFVTGAHRYITKPFAIDELVDCVGTVLDA